MSQQPELSHCSMSLSQPLLYMKSISFCLFFVVASLKYVIRLIGLYCTSDLRKVQELESKFNNAYSQSLSTKDERIHVLEKRVEETIRDSTQLREDLVAARKQNEHLKERSNGGNGNVSPWGSPGVSLVYTNTSSAQDGATKELGPDAGMVRERTILQEQVSSGRVCGL